MGNVVGMLVAVVVLIAGMVFSVLGMGWLGALLSTIGIVLGIALLIKVPRHAG
jgi:hypothetical protein